MSSENLRNFAVPVDFTAAALTLTPQAHSGVTVNSNLAATQAITLPAATGSGNIYRIWVNITKTGDLTITTNGSDDYVGGVVVATDASGETHSSDGTDTIITMNGTTTGGVRGSWVELQDIASATWRVSGYLVSSGVEATPFS
jgi:hypothetical protein